MSRSAVLRRVTHQAQAAVLKMKRQAATQQAKTDPALATAVAIVKAVNRTRLLSTIAPVETSADVSPVPLPEDLAAVPVLGIKTRESSVLRPRNFEGAHVTPTAAEDAVIRAQARGGGNFGREELWAVITREGETKAERFYWAKPGAIASHFPDAYTHERQAMAGVHVGPTRDAVLVQRFAMLKPTGT